ncbi:phospholipid-translocating p-type flippase subfamily protein, partial [Cystoisospora suis]
DESDPGGRRDLPPASSSVREGRNARGGKDERGGAARSSYETNENKNLEETYLCLTENELLRFGVCPRTWKDVKVGDLILCLKNECFPADMILLTTSDSRGGAFIETASLDGETNL